METRSTDLKRAGRTGALLLLLWFGILTTAFAQVNANTAKAIHEGRRPRLVVVISIDQFRADYLRRLTDLYLPPTQGGNVGGFRYLMTNGADFLDARYNHFPLYTAPGHAVILTGGYPYKTGIVSNNWWNRETNRDMYCVDDPRYKVVGAAPTSKATPMGPLNLRSSTVGDELKLATAGRAKVVTLSLKDRAAILMGGHTQDVCIWFDTEGGRWISSTAFSRDGRLPAWVESINTEGIPTKALGQDWKPVVSAEMLAARSFAPALPPDANPSGIGRTFPHRIGTERTAANYNGFTLTPYANAFVFETAKRAVAAEKLGQRTDGVTDILAINLSTNDYIGHAFGPYSPEAVDCAVQTDRQLSDFLNYLNRTVPGGLKSLVFAITADHGVSPIPEDVAARNIIGDSGRVTSRVIPDAIQKALAARFGEDVWIPKSADGTENGGFIENFTYLNDAAIGRAIAAGKAKSRAEIEDAAVEAVRALNLPGIYDIYSRSRVLSGALPPSVMSRHFGHGVHPKLTGDLIYIVDPMHLASSAPTTHGTPYTYDTHVPLLLCGFGITPGTFADPVSPADLAPTLCALLGIEFPSACDGLILRQALR
jgi:predicted AlkP superfamily pyrophosphatase or phosphodiesterase